MSGVITAIAVVAEVVAVAVGTGLAAIGASGAVIGMVGSAVASVVSGAITGALIGAVVGGVSSAVTGGDIGKGMLNGALMGAATGGIAGGIGEAASYFSTAGDIAGGATNAGATVDTANTGTQTLGESFPAISGQNSAQIAAEESTLMGETATEAAGPTIESATSQTAANQLQSEAASNAAQPVADLTKASTDQTALQGTSSSSPSGDGLIGKAWKGLGDKGQSTLVEGVLKGGTEFIKAGMTPSKAESDIAVLEKQHELSRINAIPGLESQQILPTSVSQGAAPVGNYYARGRLGQNATQVANAASLQYPMNAYRPAVGGAA